MKPLVLFGSQASGKTTIAFLIAEAMGFAKSIQTPAEGYAHLQAEWGLKSGLCIVDICTQREYDTLVYLHNKKKRPLIICTQNALVFYGDVLVFNLDEFKSHRKEVGHGITRF